MVHKNWSSSNGGEVVVQNRFSIPPFDLHTIKNCLQVSQLCLPFVRYFAETLLMKIFFEILLVNTFCWNFIGEYILLKLDWWRYFVETWLVKMCFWNSFCENILLKLYWWRYFVETLLVRIFCGNFIGEDILLKLYWWGYFDETSSSNLRNSLYFTRAPPWLAQDYFQPQSWLFPEYYLNFRGKLNVDLAPSALKFIFNLNSFCTKCHWNCPQLFLSSVRKP